MASPARFALLLSGLLAVGAVALGLYVAVNRDCGSAGACDDGAAAVSYTHLTLPTILLV